jgi:hypothetical protein
MIGPGRIRQAGGTKVARKKKKEARKAQKKAPTKASKKAAKKKAAKKKPAGKKTAARKTARKPSFSGPAGGFAAPMLPGMAEGIETEEFEPEAGLVADDEEDEEVDFPENEEIVATPDLEKHGDDDEGEW